MEEWKINIIKIYHLSSQIANIICSKRGESEKELLLCLFTVIINTRKQSSVHKEDSPHHVGPF